jgi:hypothetical protein
MQFGNAKFQPDFDACNAQAKTSHIQALQAVAAGQLKLSRPSWDTEETIDMDAVQALIDTLQVVTVIPEGGIKPELDAVIIGVDIDAKTLANACGIEAVVSE